jgi:AraC-like DNA-binding protein/ActR/RegA family two-component response regulator
VTSGNKPTLLWFDCISGIEEPTLRVQCARVFEVARSTLLGQAAEEIGRVKPSALCFDFDHPDQVRLSAMQAIKKANPKLPILMLTVHHSESLAVWAFRARVWNYLVKPVPPAEFAANLDALARICARGSPPRIAQTLEAAVPLDLPVQPLDPATARLQPALQHVMQRYHEKVSASVAAAACGLTRFEFSRKFRAAFGMTFRDYVVQVRIAEARRLLTEGALSVTEVGFAVGFNDGSHFARMFRRHAHVLPSEFRSFSLAGYQAGTPPAGPDVPAAAASGAGRAAAAAPPTGRFAVPWAAAFERRLATRRHRHAIRPARTASEDGQELGAVDDDRGPATG